MKFLKRVFVFVLALVGLFLLVALFVDGEYHVKREISINKPSAEVFDYVLYLKNQGEFSVWQQMDPNMKKIYTGTDGTVGFISAWESDNENVGKGEQEIIRIEPGKRIDYELRFIEPFEAKDQAYMEMKSTGEASTNVTWGFDGKMNYPMNFFALFMDMDEMLGKDLQTGLDNLKVVLEK